MSCLLRARIGQRSELVFDVGLGLDIRFGLDAAEGVRGQAGVRDALAAAGDDPVAACALAADGHIAGLAFAYDRETNTRADSAGHPVLARVSAWTLRSTTAPAPVVARILSLRCICHAAKLANLARAVATTAFVLLPARRQVREALGDERVSRHEALEGSSSAWPWRRRQPYQVGVHLTSMVGAAQPVCAIQARPIVIGRQRVTLHPTRFPHLLVTSAHVVVAGRAVAAFVHTCPRVAALPHHGICTQEPANWAMEARTSDEVVEHVRQQRLWSHHDGPTDVVAPPNPIVAQRVLLAGRGSDSLGLGCEARGVLLAQALVASPVADGRNQDGCKLCFGAGHRVVCAGTE